MEWHWLLEPLVQLEPAACVPTGPVAGTQRPVPPSSWQMSPLGHWPLAAHAWAQRAMPSAKSSQ